MGIALNMDEVYRTGDVDKFLERVQAYCEMRLVGKYFAGMEKDDVVQEVLIKVYRSMPYYDSRRAGVVTFISNIINSVIKDSYKKSTTLKTQAVVSGLDGQAVNEDHDEQLSTLEYIGVEEYGYTEVEVITDIMDNLGLTELEKGIFKLRCAGYSFEEIGKFYGYSKVWVNKLWRGIEEKYKFLHSRT